MSDSVFFSVIVPTFNQAHFLAEALDSLLAQTDDDWEAIVVNDGSTDSTSEVVEYYAGKDSRVRYIHKTNGGVASALNVGLLSARGKWVHWLSSDDLFEPEKLKINRQWITANPECSFFFSYFSLLRESTGKIEKRDLWGPLPDANHQVLTLFYRNYVSGISICVNREAWLAVGGFNESLKYAQDYDQWLRLLQRYRGVFIPERTVISRNHAAQGSETFPEACYFDTAKAAIRFINEHSFRELLPWVDFQDSEAVFKAVLCTLNIASDRSAFLYSLGVHPALVIRLLEWVLSDECGDLELRSLVRMRIEENALHAGDDDWGWMWNQLATAVQSQGMLVDYCPIDPVVVGLREYYQRRLTGDESAAPLLDYFVKFESIEPFSPGAIGTAGPRIVFLLDEEQEISAITPGLRRLTERGCRNLAVVRSFDEGLSAWEQFAWGDIIRVCGDDRDLFPWLGQVELVVRLPGASLPVWLRGVAHLELSSYQSLTLVEQYINDAFFSHNKSRRPVIFLERVLWGGGAERVVWDLVQYLDRRYYQPVILTMFDEHTQAPKLPSHVVTYNRQSFSNKVSDSTHLSQSVTLRRRIFGKLHRSYHRIVPSDFRAKLQLGRRLIRLRQRVLAFNLHKHETHASSSELYAASKVSEGESGRVLDYVGAVNHYNYCLKNVLKLIPLYENNPIVVAVMEEAAVTAWLAQAGDRFPYVVSLHSLESKCLADIYPTSERRSVESYWLSKACEDAAFVTLPSDGCIDDLTHHFQLVGNNVRKLRNPVDCSRVRRLSFLYDDAAAQWRDLSAGFRFIHVGRLNPQKNHDLLLDACAELKRRGLLFSLAIVGEGHDRERIAKRVTDLGLVDHVTLVGEKQNPFPWISAADALVLTSRFEAFALVLVEAMVCGTPVISVDAPTGPIEVLAAGEYGQLVPNDDSVALADGMEQLMRNPDRCKRLIARGYERAEGFDIKLVVREWQSLIDATLPL